MHVHELGGAGHRDFDHGLPTQPVVEVVGDQQQPFGPTKHRRVLFQVGQELVERVDRDQLDTRPGVEFGRRDAGKGPRHHRARPRVPVAVRRPERTPLPVQQHVIDRPGIHRHRTQRRHLRQRLLQAGPDLLLQRLHVPEEVAVPFDQGRLEAVHLGHVQDRSFQPAQHGTPAGGAQVEGQVACSPLTHSRVLVQLPGCSVRGPSADGSRTPGRPARGPGRHRDGDALRPPAARRRSRTPPVACARP